MIVCVDIGNRRNIYTAISSHISVAFFPPHAAYRVAWVSLNTYVTLGTLGTLGVGVGR